jgi:hypothetical protein
MTSGTVTPDNHVVATRDNRMRGSSLRVVSHPLFPPLHMCWLNILVCWSLRLAASYLYSRKTTQVAEATAIRVLSHIRPGQTVVIPGSHTAAWEAPVVRRHCLLWELSRQSRLVIQIQTPRLTSGGTMRRCPKAVSRRNPWSLMCPHQRHSRSSGNLTEDGVIITCNIWA